MTSYIYRITNTSNGRFYIGRTKDPEKRFRVHMAKLKLGNHQNGAMQDDWNDGENSFQFTITETLDDSQAVIREQALLDEYFDYGVNCYNLQPSATGGAQGSKAKLRRVKLNTKILPETKELLREYRGIDLGMLIDQLVSAHFKNADT